MNWKKRHEGISYFNEIELFDNLEIGVAVINKNAEVLEANKFFCKILNIDCEKLLGDNFFQVIQPKKDDIQNQKFEKLLTKKERGIQFEQYLSTVINEYKWIDISIKPFESRNIADDVFVVMLRDITEKKETQNELIDTLEYNKCINETSPIGILRADEEGRLVYANDQAEKILGISKTDITKRAYNSPEWKIADIDGNPLKEEDMPFSMVKRTKKSIYRYRHAIIWPNGEKVFLSINAKPILDSQNSFKGVITSIEDITKLVNSEKQFVENNNFKNVMIHKATEGICVCHDIPEFPFIQFTVWNNKMKEITGYTLEEINRLGWFDTLFYNTQERENAKKRIEDTKKGKEMPTMDWEIKSKNGERKMITISASAINEINGSPHIMALMNDYTAKHKYEKNLKESNKKLAELNTTKDKFFSILAHDLKNPFGAILGVVDLLEEATERGDFAAIKRSTNILRRSSQKGYDLLINLLDWSRTQTGKIKFNPEWINLYNIVKDNIELFDNISTQKKIAVTSYIDKDIKLFVDKNMLNTILRNFISNALKYTKEGGKIRIESKLKYDKVSISIVDSGVGMSPENISKLFNLDANYTTIGTANETGTGLGLIVCKEFVEKHDGNIDVKSIPDEGSVFSFTIPIKKNKISSVAEPHSDKLTMSDKKKILVVEDEEVNFLLLREILMLNNIPFIYARNGKEAVETCSDNKEISVILMDIKMPIMNGYEATKLIKQKSPEIPVVALTAFEIEPNKKKLFTDYLSKPVEKKKLLKLLANY